MKRLLLGLLSLLLLIPLPLSAPRADFISGGGGGALAIGNPVSGCGTIGFVLFVNTGNLLGCEAASGSGTVTTSGSPVSGELAFFSGGTIITNGNLTGDCTTTNTSATTCLKTNGVAFTSAATTAIGTSGATIPLNNGSITLSGTNAFTGPSFTFNNSTIRLLGSSTGYTTVTSGNASATNYTITIPANTGTVAELNLAQTWTAAQTYNNSDILLLGSSTGATTLSSANASATNYTATYPANTGTLAELNLAQTWSANQTYSAEIITNASAAGSAGINLPPGAAPTSPVNGDVWTTSAGMFAQINGATVGPFGSGGASLTVTDGTNTVSSTTTETFGTSFVVSGSAGSATVNVNQPYAVQTGSYTLLSTDGAKLEIMNCSSACNLTLNTGVLGDKGTFFFHSIGAGAVTLNGTGTLVGYGGTVVPNDGGGVCTYELSITTYLCQGLGYQPNMVYSNVVGQTFTGGIHPTAFSNGTATSGTTTIDCGNGPIQSLTDGGAFTLAMSSNDGTCVLRITNNASAGTITFSGFSEGTNKGDSLTTTSGNIFDITLTRIGGNPHYLVSALQ